MHSLHRQYVLMQGTTSASMVAVNFSCQDVLPDRKADPRCVTASNPGCAGEAAEGEVCLRCGFQLQNMQGPDSNSARAVPKWDRHLL